MGASNVFLSARSLLPSDISEPAPAVESSDIFYKVCFLDIEDADTQFNSWDDQDGIWRFDTTNIIFSHIKSQVASLDLDFNFILKKLIIQNIPPEVSIEALVNANNCHLTLISTDIDASEHFVLDRDLNSNLLSQNVELFYNVQEFSIDQCTWSKREVKRCMRSQGLAHFLV